MLIFKTDCVIRQLESAVLLLKKYWNLILFSSVAS